jgi:hypothetical protein
MRTKTTILEFNDSFAGGAVAAAARHLPFGVGAWAPPTVAASACDGDSQPRAAKAALTSD